MRLGLKKNLKRILIAAVVVALIAGLVAGYRYFRVSSGSAVSVYSVSDVAETEDWYSSDTMYGTVKSDRTQSVYLSSTQTVKEVKVTQGQTVKKGDVLLTYDTSLQELEIEKAKLEIQKQQQDLKKYKSDLAKVNTYRAGVPVPKSQQVDTDSSDWGGSDTIDDSSYDSMDDSMDDSLDAGTGITALSADAGSSVSTLLTRLIGSEGAASVLSAEAGSQVTTTAETTTTAASAESSTGTTTAEASAESSTGTTAAEASAESSTETTAAKSTKKAKKAAAAGSTSAAAETTTAAETATAAETTTAAADNNYPALESGEGTTKNPYVYHYTKECVFDQNFLSYLRQNSEKDTVTVTMQIVVGADEEKKDPGEVVGSFTFTITTVKDSDGNVTGYSMQMTQISIGEESYDLTPINEGKEVTKEETTTAAESSSSAESSSESSSETTAAETTAEETAETPEVVTEPEDETTTASETASDGGGSDDGGGDGGDDESVTYTAEEIKQMKETLEQNIKDLDLDIRVAQFNLEKKQKELESTQVTAKFDGTITAVNDEETAKSENSVFIRLSAGGGYYISGSVSELKLDQMKVGQKMQITSYDTGETCTGEVTKISAFPSSSTDGDYYTDGTGNTNVSYYPFTVYVKEADASLQDGEYVEMAFASDSDSGDSLYLMNSMFRTEGGSSYVYVRGKDGRLKKQTVKIGRSLGDGYTEILSGLSIDDYIAFPYGQDIQEGAKTKKASAEELYEYG